MAEKTDYKVNHRIRVPEVRVISDDGENLGVIKTSQALKMSLEKELDLVIISEGANPPVARILDFNKFAYEENKKAAQVKSKAKKTDVKEIRFNGRIDDGAIKVKANRAISFLNAGDKVKVTVVLRGREKAFPEVADAKLQKFLEEISAVGKLEAEPKKTAGNVTASIIRK